MYKLSTKLCILITYTLILGCSTTSSKIWFESTDSLVSHGNYKKALSQLQEEKQTKTKLYKKIVSLSHKRSDEKLVLIKEMIHSKDWGKAQETLRHLTNYHVWDNRFAHYKTLLTESINNEKRLITTQSLLAKSKLLEAKLSKYDFDMRLNNSHYNWSISKIFLKNEKKELAKALYQQTVLALAERDYENAHKTYAQALKLNSELQKYGLSETINAGLNTSNQNSILSRQTTLLKRLDKALAQENFKDIIALQNILSNAPFKGKRVNAAINRSSAIRLKNAKLLDKQADTVYRQGDIAHAINLWEEANYLAPSLHSLQEKLARANKVQTKLLKLRSQR